jgi:hypothetical protein
MKPGTQIDAYGFAVNTGIDQQEAIRQFKREELQASKSLVIWGDTFVNTAGGIRHEIASMPISEQSSKYEFQFEASYCGV